jgi:hypothetical protein
MVPLVPHWGKMPTKLALEIVLYALVITMFTYKFWCEKDCYIEKVLVKYNFMDVGDGPEGPLKNQGNPA